MKAEVNFYSKLGDLVQSYPFETEKEANEFLDKTLENWKYLRERDEAMKRWSRWSEHTFGDHDGQLHLEAFKNKSTLRRYVRREFFLYK